MAAPNAPPAPPEPPRDLARLQSVEQCVIDAVEAAATVTEELSRFGGSTTASSNDHLNALCQRFLDHISRAQALLLEAAEGAAPARGFEATVYQSMARVHLASEKVGVVTQHLRAMQAAIDAHRARVAAEVAGPGAGPGPGSA